MPSGAQVCVCEGHECGVFYWLCGCCESGGVEQALCEQKTQDGALTFTCDRPAGHRGKHRSGRDLEWRADAVLVSKPNLPGEQRVESTCRKCGQKVYKSPTSEMWLHTTMQFHSADPVASALAREFGEPT